MTICDGTGAQQRGFKPSSRLKKQQTSCKRSTPSVSNPFDGTIPHTYSFKVGDYPAQEILKFGPLDLNKTTQEIDFMPNLIRK